MSDTVTKIGVRLTDLDGRRTDAGGVPPGYTGQYTEDYNKVKDLYAYQRVHWKVEQWLDHIKLINDAKYCFADRKTPGGSAALDDMLTDAYTREERKHEIDVARTNLKSELGPREFTLTYSDAWYTEDEDAQLAMRKAIEKLTRYYKDEIIEFHAVGEFTKANRAHVHAWYHLKGGLKITDKNFKRAWSHWDSKKKLGKGHQGGHHDTIKRVSNFAGYAEKHLEEAWLKVDINNAEISNEGSQIDEEGQDNSPPSEEADRDNKD